MEIFTNKERTIVITTTINQIVESFLFESRGEKQPDEMTIYFAQDYEEFFDIIFTFDLINGYIFKIHFNTSSIDITHVKNSEEQTTIHLKLESIIGHGSGSMERKLLCFFNGHVSHFLKEDGMKCDSYLYPEQEEFIKAFSKE